MLLQACASIHVVFCFRTYREYMSSDPNRPIYPNITDATLCGKRKVLCNKDYDVKVHKQDTYHLEQQTTCTDDPNQYDVKLYRYKTATSYFCKM